MVDQWVSTALHTRYIACRHCRPERLLSHRNPTSRVYILRFPPRARERERTLLRNLSFVFPGWYHARTVVWVARARARVCMCQRVRLRIRLRSHSVDDEHAFVLFATFRILFFSSVPRSRFFFPPALFRQRERGKEKRTLWSLCFSLSRTQPRVERTSVRAYRAGLQRNTKESLTSTHP